MINKEVLKLIEKGESEMLEFKPSVSQINEIIETVSAFANSSGGIILIGISNSGKIPGIAIGKDTVERMANKISHAIDPKIYPKISVQEIEGKKIIMINVEKSINSPHLAFGRFFKRMGKSTLLASRDELEKMIVEKKGVRWDSEICEGASLKDIDEEKVKWFLRKARYERNFDIEPETSIGEALERLELMKERELTNASILLFGKNPQKFFLQAETRCGRFKGTEPVKPFIDMKVFGGNIFDQVERSVGFVLEHIPLKVYLAGKPEREEKYEYPPDAIREAIINAVCHRDYEESSNVQIRIFDGRIEVWGSGPLPEPLTPEDLKRKHRSILRNPLIAKCFFLVKFVERWGTGTNDIIRMCLDWGLPEPLFEEVAGSLVVTFRKSKLTEENIEKLGLTERQKKAVEYLRKNKKITSKIYAKMFGITERTARNDMHDLIAKKVIEKKGVSDKTAYYVLAEI